MPKIVLIRPQSSTTSVVVPRIPLAFLYVGSVLKQSGYEVKIIDTTVESHYKEMIIEECRDAILVGITALTSEVKGGLEVSQIVKDYYNVPIVWGGIHSTLFPELTCEDELVDYVVCGEGEHTMLELVRALQAKTQIGNYFWFHQINGLSYKGNGSVEVNEAREYIRLDELFIDYTLIDMNRYFEGGTWRRTVDVQTSRGCPYHCKFCVQSALDNHKVRMMSAQRVVDECERLIKDYQANYITFVDDNFFLDKKRAVEIFEEIIRRNLRFKWFAEVRADYFKDGFVDSELLELAQASGLTNLTIGAESGVPRFLKMMGKGITTEDIVNSAVRLNKTKISTAYSFIIGLPEESKEDIVTTLRFVEDLKGIYPGAVYKITTLRAYPRSELTDGFIKEGWIKEPQSLRQFAEHKYNKVYTDSPSRPIWHSYPDFAYSIAKYSMLAFSPFTGANVRNNLKNARILLIPELLLQKVVRWRLHHQFFKFPLDMYIGEMLHRLYFSKFVRKIVRWQING